MKGEFKLYWGKIKRLLQVKHPENNVTYWLLEMEMLDPGELPGRVVQVGISDPGIKTLATALTKIHGEDAPIQLPGNEIYFSVDDKGVLSGFTPVVNAPVKLVKLYKEQHDIQEN